MAEFLNAVLSRQQPGCPIEEGLRATAAVKLAMIAYESGAKVEWDPEAERLAGGPGAAERVKRAYRAPWAHPHRD
jgi:hypothetical protein